jgi:hypothetical protein
LTAKFRFPTLLFASAHKGRGPRHHCSATGGFACISDRCTTARAFTLPADADRNAVTARFSKGVLTLEIAKAANVPAQGKQIEIKPS